MESKTPPTGLRPFAIGAVIVALLLALIVVTGCAGATQNPQAVLAQSQYAPTVRAAMDGVPGAPGPQEIVAVYFPFGPFAIKGGLIWDGQPWTPALPVQSQAMTYDSCGYAPAYVPAPQAAAPCCGAGN